MAEYIEREAAIEDFEKYNSENPKWTPSRVKAFIVRQKAADVAPVWHGQWEWFEEWNLSTSDHPTELENCGWRCSECKTPIEDTAGGYWDDAYDGPTLKYCPEYGAKMDLEA